MQMGHLKTMRLIIACYTPDPPATFVIQIYGCQNRAPYSFYFYVIPVVSLMIVCQLDMKLLSITINLQNLCSFLMNTYSKTIWETHI